MVMLRSALFSTLKRTKSLWAAKAGLGKAAANKATTINTNAILFQVVLGFIRSPSSRGQKAWMMLLHGQPNVKAFLIIRGKVLHERQKIPYLALPNLRLICSRNFIASSRSKCYNSVVRVASTHYHSLVSKGAYHGL